EFFSIITSSRKIQDSRRRRMYPPRTRMARGSTLSERRGIVHQRHEGQLLLFKVYTKAPLERQARADAEGARRAGFSQETRLRRKRKRERDVACVEGVPD